MATLSGGSNRLQNAESLDWLQAFIRPNIICRVCALISVCTLALPWLVRQSVTRYSPYPDLVVPYVLPPEEYYSLLMVAADAALDLDIFTFTSPLSLAALVFMVGVILAFFTPAAGLLQIGAVYAIAVFLVQNDFMLVDGPYLRAEYGVGIGFHIGFAASLVTIVSLSPSATEYILRPFRGLRSKMRSLSHRG